MAPPKSTASDTDSNPRKRVEKACDRCRLKKSKCDGSNPCSRCRTDNAICVFGQRKRSHDKVYPKGYVEMLEQQQQQLVGGLQVLYDIVINERGWKGAPLKKSTTGYPLTHDILERLRVLKTDSGMEIEGGFEEDLEALRKRLATNGDGLARKDSTNSDYHSQTPYPDPPSPEALFTDLPFSRLNHLPPTPPIHYSQDQHSTNYDNSPHQGDPRKILDTAMQQPDQRSSWVVQPSGPSYEGSTEYVPYQHNQDYPCHQNLPRPSNTRQLISLWPADDLTQFDLNSQE